MGVTGLWNIVSPLSKMLTLSELRGKTVAIDLSCWIVDSQSVGAADSCPKKHLRSIFFRTVALLLNGVLPVFVLEGKAPTMKYDVIRKRNNVRKNIRERKMHNQVTTKKGGRGNAFNATVKECETMLRFMGLSCVVAEGEAEAMCAYLNADGIVDGCITQDSDCFLYGATTVYRNFTLNDKSGFGCAVEEYSLQRIENVYNFGRNKMIALALLCGCDYDDGVPGIGKDGAMKWLQTVDDKDILEIFKHWGMDKKFDEHVANKCKGQDKEIFSSNEYQIRKKCMAVKHFPNQNLIDEFVVRKGVVPSKISEWSEPNVIFLNELLQTKLKWKYDYIIEKVIPILTRWNVTNLTNVEIVPSINIYSNLIVPNRIIKIRNIQSVCNYEIEWTIYDEQINLTNLCDVAHVCESVPKNLVTIEPQELVKKAYPGLVKVFEEATAAKIKKASRKRKVRRVNERGYKKIDHYFGTKRVDIRKVLSEIEPSAMSSNLKHGIDANARSQSSRNRILRNEHGVSPKLNGTLKNIYETLGDEDFLTDVEDDALEMSLIVSSVCKSSDYEHLHQRPTSALASIQKSDTVVREGTTNTASCRNSSESDEFDDDIPYVPLDIRIKN